MVYVLRYDAQVNSYLLFVTDAYPHASPLEGAETPEAGRAVELPPDDLAYAQA